MGVVGDSAGLNGPDCPNSTQVVSPLRREQLSPQCHPSSHRHPSLDLAPPQGPSAPPARVLGRLFLEPTVSHRRSEIQIREEISPSPSRR
ncbi:hypothetical protein TIFTF001_021771 [Ficus carica]|uniref:Uncharacterized protein n=1 Tax=Ficus carica TaxID=3494 RepID=A0AA88AV68_FICCA|nr:hypothetical protein TIFTF001_021771 [Ficus carica]